MVGAMDGFQLIQDGLMQAEAKAARLARERTLMAELGEVYRECKVMNPPDCACMCR